MRRAGLVGLTAATLLLVAACTDTNTGNTTTVPTLAPPAIGTGGTAQSPPPDLDPERIVAGAALYQEHCAECHRTDLSGAPNWQIPNDDGTYEPPPQDSTGHTWHHPDQVLLELVRDGSANPIAMMPTFGDVLSDRQILDILEFIKSSWGEEERRIQWGATLQDEGETR